MLINQKKVLLLQALYILFYLVAALITLVPSLGDPGETLGYQTGQILGVIGLSGLAMQFFLASRFKFVERGVGLDRIMRWHRTNGLLIVAAVLLHPAFIYGSLLLKGVPFTVLQQSYSIFHLTGTVALFLILLTVALTIFSNRIGLDYEVWKIIHQVAYVILGLGLYHSYNLGTDILLERPLMYWWWFLILIVVFSFVYRYGVRWWWLRRSWYEVIEVNRPTPDVVNIRLMPKSGTNLEFLPGQFAFVQFFSERVSSEEHHFTISSSPSDDYISFTVKASGDFTGTLPDIEVGDVAQIDGPYGVFSAVGVKKPVVFIAGGIGITPVMSMLRTMQDGERPSSVTLIYGNKTEQDIVFREELDQMMSEGWLEIEHVLSQEEHPEFAHGHIDKTVLEKVVTDFDEAYFFIVGPPLMMDSVEKILLARGVSHERILTERFALR